MQVKNVQEALAFCGYPENSNQIDTSKYPEKHREAIQAVADLFIIHEAYNDREDANYNDWDQDKHFIIWDLEVDKNNPSGFRFFDSYCEVTYSLTICGPRLCFLKQEDIAHAVENHIELYRKVNKMMTELKG